MVRETLNVIKAAAADDPDAICWHINNLFCRDYKAGRGEGKFFGKMRRHLSVNPFSDTYLCVRLWPIVDILPTFVEHVIIEYDAMMVAFRVACCVTWTAGHHISQSDFLV